MRLTKFNDQENQILLEIANEIEIKKLNIKVFLPSLFENKTKRCVSYNALKKQLNKLYIDKKDRTSTLRTKIINNKNIYITEICTQHQKKNILSKYILQKIRKIKSAKNQNKSINVKKKRYYLYFYTAILSHCCRTRYKIVPNNTKKY
jgi:hypothetical protein